MTKHERNLAHTEAEPVLPRLLKVSRAASELDCSKSKVYDLISRGVLQTVIIDGMVRVPREGLEAYIDQCMKNTGSASIGENGSRSAGAGPTSRDRRSVLTQNRISNRKRSARSGN